MYYIRKKPVKANCLNPECIKEFEYVARKHGGGKHKKYCSSACCKRFWYLKTYLGFIPITTEVREYPQKSIEEVKAAKRGYARVKKLKKYGITEEVFERWLRHQKYRCLGCEDKIDRLAARVDHDHKTGKARGLLCDHCNWALGHAKDSTTTLRNLIEYLEVR